MKVLVIYDKAGNVLASMTGITATEALPLICEVPDGYHVESVDVETGEAVLAKNPKTETERLEELEAQMDALLGVE